MSEIYECSFIYSVDFITNLTFNVVLSSSISSVTTT